MKIKFREGYPKDLKKRIEFIDRLGYSFGWKFLVYQEKIGMMSFFKNQGYNRMRINVYISNMTVATCLDHPVRGSTQLFRKNVTNMELSNIFKNPRIHTGKGYYTNGSK